MRNIKEDHHRSNRNHRVSNQSVQIACLDPGRRSRAYRTDGKSNPYKRRPAIAAGRRNVWPDMLRFAICIAAVVLMLLVLSGPVSGHFLKSKAAMQPDLLLSEVQYKVVEIKKGDSLWSIANDNLGPGYDDVKAYIKDIKDCNQLDSDHIRAGNYLMLPYYGYESKDFAAN